MSMTGKPTLEAIVREHGSFIRKTLAGFGVAARAVPDVEQEVLRAVAHGCPTFDPLLAQRPDAALRAWLCGICQRQAANHHRAESRRNETLRADEDMNTAPSSEPTAEEQLLEAERKALLDALTASLDPRQRAVLIAYEIEGVPMREVAAAQSIPINTAYNRLRLARMALCLAAHRWLASGRVAFTRGPRR